MIISWSRIDLLVHFATHGIRSILLQYPYQMHHITVVLTLFLIPANWIRLYEVTKQFYYSKYFLKCSVVTCVVNCTALYLHKSQPTIVKAYLVIFDSHQSLNTLNCFGWYFIYFNGTSAVKEHSTNQGEGTLK